MGYEGVGLALDFAYSMYQSGQAKEQGEREAEAIKEAAEANARISRYDAEIARDTANEIHKKSIYNMERQIRKVDIILSSQRAGYASKGVVISTGSPLDVQVDSYRRGMEDLRIIDYEGRKAEDQAKNLAQRYEMLAEAGLKEAAMNAANIESAYNQRAQNIMYEGASKAAGSIYNYGKRNQWWD